MLAVALSEVVPAAAVVLGDGDEELLDPHPARRKAAQPRAALTVSPDRRAIRPTPYPPQEGSPLGTNFRLTVERAREVTSAEWRSSPLDRGTKPSYP